MKKKQANFKSSNKTLQWNPALTDVKGPIKLICYEQIFNIANTKNNKWLEKTKS